MQNNIFVTTQFSINGDGLFYPSISIYFSGCDKKVKCKNCHNPELQKQGNGFNTNTDDIIKDLEAKVSEWFKIYPIFALTYLGGEALSPWNREATLKISKHFKEKYNENIKNIVYTWRYLEDLKDITEFVSFMDLGILGDFKEELYVKNQVPSSSNQYIYDFKRHIKLDNIIKEE